MNPDVHPMSVAETIAAHGLERVAHFTPEKNLHHIEVFSSGVMVLVP